MFLTGVKDLDLNILRNLNDRDLLNACLTNKRAQQICSDENFWRFRYYEKYGEQGAAYKSPNRSWKQYYLLTLRYAERYSPKRAAERAAEKGHLDLLKYFMGLVSPKYLGPIDSALREAALHNYTDMIDYLLDLLPEDPEMRQDYIAMIIEGAAEANNKELLNRFLPLADQETIGGYVIYGASRGGHTDLVKLFIDRGDEFDPESVIAGAAYSGNLELLKYLRNLPRENDEDDSEEDGEWGSYMEMADNAGLGGHRHIVDYLANKYPESLKNALSGAAAGGHIELARYILARIRENTEMEPNIRAALCSAAATGKKDMIVFLIEQGATKDDIRRSVSCAINNGEKEIERFMNNELL